MKKIWRIMVVFSLCCVLFGCGNSNDTETDNKRDLRDFPKIEELADKTLHEINGSPAIQDTKTKIEYDSATSNFEDSIALHYNTSNDGTITLLFNTKSNTLKSAAVEMPEEKALNSNDFIAIISSFSSISDFNIAGEQYSEIGKIAANMETKMVGELIVSMKNIDGIYEFMIIAE